MVAYGVDAVRVFLEAVVGERLSLGMRRGESLASQC